MRNSWGVIGCGWLGLPFAKHLINKGDKVIGTTTSKDKIELLKNAGISPVLLTSPNNSKPNNIFNDCNYALLNIPPSLLKENYADEMLRLCSLFNSESQIIFISSVSVYADKNQTATENDNLDGHSRNAPYIIAAEKVLQQTLKERLTIIRMAGLVGAGRHPVVHMSEKNYAGGKEKINLIHLEDCIGLIDKVVEKNYFGEILNGCSSQHPSKTDYYTYAAQQLNIPPPIFQNNENKWKKVSNLKSINSLKYSYIYGSPFDFPL